MNKAAIFSSLFCVLNLFAFAQSGFGLRAGLVVSDDRWVGDDELSLTEFRSSDELFSYGFGAFHRSEISELFSFTPSLEFKRKGFRSNHETLDDYVFISERLGLHLQTEWRVLEKVRLLVGLEYAFSIGQVNKEGSSVQRGGLIEVKDDLIVNAGLLAQISDEFTLGARFQHSFIPYGSIQFTNELGQDIQKVELYQRAVIVEVLYTIPFLAKEKN
jgi:hypothetical protein